MNLWIILLFISLMDLDMVSTQGAYCKTERIAFFFYRLNLITLIESKIFYLYDRKKITTFVLYNNDIVLKYCIGKIGNKYTINYQ